MGILLVPPMGLEPTHRKTLEPKSSTSANSVTAANWGSYEPSHIPSSIAVSGTFLGIAKDEIVNISYHSSYLLSTFLGSRSFRHKILLTKKRTLVWVFQGSHLWPSHRTSHKMIMKTATPKPPSRKVLATLSLKEPTTVLRIK